MPAENFEKGLLQTATRMLDMAVNEGAGYDSLINVLSLMCVLSILNRNQPAAQQPAASPAANPLQKLIGELAKGDAGGPSPETLMTLLPLLNSPQLKSKLNPATLTAVMGLLNNMGGSGGDKQESKSEKTEKVERSEKATVKPDPPENKNELPAAAIVTAEHPPERLETVHNDPEKRAPGKYLNWKSSF
ncbi:MAG: hypothetical protein N2491_10150 [Negativicutes bacterium]|nr:hypothetical protein [Negativicutes bacterium]